MAKCLNAGTEKIASGLLVPGIRQPLATTEQREKLAELARRVTGPEVAIAHRVHVAADHLTHQ